MQTKFLTCPHCSASLRIRDRRFIGQPIACPDCEKPVLILANGPDEFTIQTTDKFAVPQNSKPVKPRQPTQKTTATQKNQLPHPHSNRGAIRQWLSSPLVLAWSIAAASTLVVLTLLLNSYFRSKEAVVAKQQNSTTPKVAPKVVPTIDNSRLAKPGQTATESLQHLGKLLDEFYGERQQFPTGSVVPSQVAANKRLSWMATLVGSLDESSPPVWEQAWDNPINEPFVNQIVPAYLNPQLTTNNQIQGQPVSHFVGISGVGKDAASLPLTDKNAGIFGFHRRVQQTDIKDGLSNTMMVSGVSSQIGHWATAGSPTMRSLTKAPYVNGLDGLSTGDENSMQVLMADGSVRTISVDVAAQVVRDMATIAGDDLLELVEADKNKSQQEVAINEKPNIAEPIVAPLPHDVVPPDVDEKPDVPQQPVVDVAARLAQPILNFNQSTPITLAEMLYQLEELIGVRIVADEEKLGAATLEKKVMFQLASTTTGAILEHVLSSYELSYRIVDSQIHIISVAP